VIHLFDGLDLAPNGADIGLVDYGSTLTPTLGGPSQRVNRMGSRFRMNVTMPPLQGANGRKFVSRLIRGKSEGVRLPLPLLDFDPGVPGSPLVDGSGQAGMTLALKSATPGYAFREGQFFSVVTGGKHHLHPVASEVIVASDGMVDVPLGIMLRAQHLDGDALHVSEPMAEGFIDGDEVMWNLALGNFIGISFGLTEAQ